MIRIRPSLLIVGIGLVVGCVAGPGASNAPTLGSVSTLTVAKSIPNAGITMDPPGNVSPKIQAQDALGLCMSGIASCAGGPADAQLAIVTDSGSAQQDSSGRLTPLMQSKLVWALSWSNVPCVHSAGPFRQASAGVTPSRTP